MSEIQSSSGAPIEQVIGDQILASKHRVERPIDIKRPGQFALQVNDRAAQVVHAPIWGELVDQGGIDWEPPRDFVDDLNTCVQGDIPNDTLFRIGMYIGDTFLISQMNDESGEGT